MMTNVTKLLGVGMASVILAGSVDLASAAPRHGGHVGGHHYAYRGHRGHGGALAAGAALGILGAAAAGIAANNYYNDGYYGGPAYGYYGAPAYGYDQRY